VKKIKDAFEKPFRNNATTSLPSQSRSIFNASSSAAVDLTSKGKGKEKATSLSESSTTPRDRLRPPREPSPIWDLELDLDLDADASIDNSPQSGPPPVPRTPDARADVDLMNESSSPVWDIELDLNGSDDDNDAQGRGQDGFGAAALL
jgi:DNA excision repair protein ERCC-1